MRLIPYTIPVLVTGIFMVLVHAGLYWPGPFLLPLVNLAHKWSGKFTARQMIEEYRFFHSSASMKGFITICGLLFVAFNGWIVYFLSTHNLTTLQWIFFVYSVLLLNSNFSISLAHELMHSPSAIDQASAEIILLINGFFYLKTDHLYIHHRFVATDGDPASAKFGQPFYSYLFRSVRQRAGMVFGAGNKLPPIQRAQIVRITALRLLVCLLLLVFAWQLSILVFAWLTAQFLFVTFIYEIITYIQHYGLRRIQRQGKTSGVEIMHSWNCGYRLSAWMHFMMPVHSIHHLKSEPDLNTLQDPGPVYPYSFSRMVVAALFPDYWFNIMNPRVRAVTQS